MIRGTWLFFPNTNQNKGQTKLGNNNINSKGFGYCNGIHPCLIVHSILYLDWMEAILDTPNALHRRHCQPMHGTERGQAGIGREVPASVQKQLRNHPELLTYRYIEIC